MTEPALRFHGLGFAYRPDAWLLRGLSGEVRRGEALAVLGANGRGKTTLLRLLLGALKPQEGAVHANGRLAFVPQLFQVAFDFSVLDMVLMGRARRIGFLSQPSRTDEKMALEALDRLRLADLASRYFGELSGGQRQLVMLARALAAEAEALILDEPASALDLANQELMLTWIRRLAKHDELAVIFTTHQPVHALTAADRAILLIGPNEVVAGPVERVLTVERLSQLYGVELLPIEVERGGQRRLSLAPIFETDGK